MGLHPRASRAKPDPGAREAGPPVRPREGLPVRHAARTIPLPLASRGSGLRGDAEPRPSGDALRTVSAPDGLRDARSTAAPFQVRPSRAADREALGAFGHSPGVAQAFCASPGRRLAWRLKGIRVVGVLAEDRAGVLG